jgi:hypothetical protein
MTVAQPSDADRGPRPCHGWQPPAAAEPGPLDAFLRAQPSYWGLPQGPDGSGFAALRFDASPGSAARTRRFLRGTLTSWHLDELMDDAAAVVAELVANAVTHALGPPAARPAPATAWLALVRMEGAVVCAVADPSPELPAPAEPEPFAESGRGLHIVAELSDSWGHCAAAPAGKTVWARLARTDGGS